ncbi:FAD-binding and (Fe-S)-binding domain-containing protein [Vibrio casei]|uniref:D-lactate dehydrogenase (cytochrome) n=1 Tax=Vibrio casei TaxID=673372 RepID=A0A368LJD8_9VIBR|nr:FAD-binding and (Fe-S)-binding domain-containing protein [Vibrio casei]RCS70869.1 FAD-binding oxidoreductase [Vibrio casei]SJN40422.1 Predicted D-lactate dehydrogenase, Fe-S protein, FAD/FMN-containing [Vibrio casei]
MDNYSQLEHAFSQRIPLDRIITQQDKRLAYGTDASFYRLVPKIVLRLQDLEEVLYAMRCCREHQLPFTFRAAGTSLSGQAVSDSVLITLTDDWRTYKIYDSGQKISLQPGVIGADANKYLAPFQRKIGPDPASINACKIGGIAANNSSGMCCGTAQNSYQTLDSMKIVFADGAILDTGNPQSIERFQTTHADFIKQISLLSQETKSNHDLSHLIHHKYRLKNTTGYSINALVDFSDPIQIIQHLMIGSEGSLGFIAEITYHTVIEHQHKASALLVFSDIEQASQAVTILSNTPVAAVEMMDGRSLRSVANKPGMPNFIKQLDLEAAALLIESHATDQEQLMHQCELILSRLSDFNIMESVPFTCDPETVTGLWNIRKGLFPAVGAVREAGTTVIIEDVAFPIEHLAQGVRELQQLFEKYDYSEGIIFGHALDGNLHFVFTQGFEAQAEVERYGQFMDDVTQLVAVKYQGSLKAEHGTGRNMAPYVELEWGKEGYRLMQKIKQLFDPQGLLNPGVIINDNPHAHLSHLKPMPKADDLVDRCIECGFCEPVCPSRTLSLSPRQRIVLYRELQQQKREGKDTVPELEELFNYQGVETCAATGLCEQRCPVGINTGDLVKKLRADQFTQHKAPLIARWTSDHFSTATAAVKYGLTINHILTRLVGRNIMSRTANGVRNISQNRTPLWLPEIPKANTHKLPMNTLKQAEQDRGKIADVQHKKVVYFPSCVSRTMGSNTESSSLTEITMSLLTKAGFDIILPKDLSEQCCGMPYKSKGLNDLGDKKSHQLEQTLWQASQQGLYPILIDTSPCVKQSLTQFTKPLSLFEPSEFIMKHALNHLELSPINETVMLHITCSSRTMGLENTMLDLAKQCAKKVIVPEHIQCCGWAGDKGFNTPELNKAALHPLKDQVPTHCTRGFSNSLTCEIGLSHHSGVPYQSILYLVSEATQLQSEMY